MFRFLGETLSIVRFFTTLVLLGSVIYFGYLIYANGFDVGQAWIDLMGLVSEGWEWCKWLWSKIVEIFA